MHSSPQASSLKLHSIRIAHGRRQDSMYESPEDVLWLPWPSLKLRRRAKSFEGRTRRRTLHCAMWSSACGATLSRVRCQLR